MKLSALTVTPIELTGVEPLMRIELIPPFYENGALSTELQRQAQPREPEPRAAIPVPGPPLDSRRAYLGGGVANP